MPQDVRKRCTKCNCIRPRNDFATINKKTKKQQSWCKFCMKVYQEEYKIKNIDKIRLKRRRYYVENTDKVRNATKKWRIANPDKHKLTGRKRHLRNNYGLTNEQYLGMNKNQAGLCKICRKKEKRVQFGKITPLSVDHCHKTGKVRGLLCDICNKKLCPLDDKKFLKKALKYLIDSGTFDILSFRKYLK